MTTFRSLVVTPTVRCIPSGARYNKLLSTTLVYETVSLHFVESLFDARIWDKKGRGKGSVRVEAAYPYEEVEVVKAFSFYDF